MQTDGILPADIPYAKLEINYIKAIGLGLLKVMSKMGISTQQSYRGARSSRPSVSIRSSSRNTSPGPQPHPGRRP
ncbi:MAG: glutamate synthase central domain-containing protein [Pirellulales bacterium]